MRYKLLSILLWCSAMVFAQNDTTALQKEKVRVFQGCSGGMMVHAGYLFGQPAGAMLPTGEQISMQGLTYGLGGSMRVNLWKYLRVGCEGFSSDLKTGVSDQYAFLQKGSYIRTGWGGILADACWRGEKVWPYIGGSIGGGAMHSLMVVDGSQDDWTPETLSILNKQSFVYVGPYVGMDVCLTKRIHFTFRLDWMLAFAQKSILLPTGPRLYVGFMFCH